MDLFLVFWEKSENSLKSYYKNYYIETTLARPSDLGFNLFYSLF